MKKTTYMLLAVLTIVGVVYLPDTKPNVSSIKMSLTVSIMGNEYKLDRREIQLILSKNFSLTQKRD
jgi:hypothetical protein